MKKTSSRKEILACLDRAMARKAPGTNSRVWLAIGDFDRLKDVNNIYGSRIVDILLEKSHQVIEEVLLDFEHACGINNIVYSLTGDEVIIVIPPSSIKDMHIGKLLDSMRAEISRRLNEVLFAFALPDFTHLTDCISSFDLLQSGSALARKGILVLPAPGERGTLVLACLERQDEQVRHGIERAVQEITRSLAFTGGEKVSGCLDWLFNPASRAFEAVNNGRIIPLAISFGAVSSDELDPLGGRKASRQKTMEGDLRAARDMIHRAQEGLKMSKIRGNSTTVGLTGAPRCVSADDEIPIRVCSLRGNLRAMNPITNDNRFKRRLSSLRKKNPAGLLVEINPFYHEGCEQTNRESLSFCNANKRRSTFGLKGVNDVYGYAWGDRVIGLLEEVVYDVLGDFFRLDETLLRKTCIARFVDKFRIHFTEPSLGTREILIMMEAIVRKFNIHRSRLKMFHLAGNLVHDRDGVRTHELLERLESTGLSDRCPQVFSYDRSISIKHYVPGIEEHVKEIKSVNAYASACALMNLRESRPGSAVAA
jgi:GGDEF domain-containing protein